MRPLCIKKYTMNRLGIWIHYGPRWFSDNEMDNLLLKNEILMDGVLNKGHFTRGLLYLNEHK